MGLDFSFNDEDYVVCIKSSTNSKTTYCKLTVYRAYLALKFILENYPNYANSHDSKFEQIYKDTNRAIGALKKEEGYANFLIERRNKLDRTLEYKFNAEKFLKIWEGKTAKLVTNIRIGPSVKIQKLLRKKQKDKCNITKLKLYAKLEKRSFMSTALTLVFDHRIPLSEHGEADPNKIDNWQIISEYVNNEKLKLCVSCLKKTCLKCALAYPEKNKKIISNDQNISEILS